MYSITDNSSLLKKVYVPKYIFPFSKATSDMVDFLFSLSARMVITGTEFSMYLVLPYVALQLYVFTLGMSLFLSQATVFFRDMRYIYAVFLTAWMYDAPALYPVSILPPKIQWVVTHLNPLYYLSNNSGALCWSVRCLPSSWFTEVHYFFRCLSLQSGHGFSERIRISLFCTFKGGETQTDG